MSIITQFRGLLRSANTEIRGLSRYLFGKRGKRLVGSLRLLYRLRLLMMLAKGKSFARFARRSEVRLWVDGKESFRRIEKLLHSAKHSILIHMFIWKDDDTGKGMAKQLIDAANRGVDITISKEAVGDIFEFQDDFLTTRESQHPVWKAFWHHPHIHIDHATNRDHGKVFVIDHEVLLLTGMNIANEYRYDWHDYLVELRGTAFVEQFLNVQLRRREDASVHLVMNLPRRKDIRPQLNQLLNEARESVVVEHCYISDQDVIDRLIALSKRGVRVTLLVPAEIDFHYHANMLTVARLLEEGRRPFMRVLLYPGVSHAKIILVDRVKAFIGSANLMTSSLDEMGEVNVLIRGRYRSLKKLREALRQDILLSRPMNAPPGFLWVSRWLAWLGL
jgi:cardiolipin synthase